MRRIAMAMIALSTLAGCVLAPPFYWGEEVHGRVVDADTKAPVEGAVVLANWKLLAGGYGHGTHLNSLVVEETRTDANGEFRFGKWGPKMRPANQALDYGPELVIFKRSYEHRYLVNHVFSNSFERRSEWSGKEIELTRFRGDAATRAHTIGLVLSMSELQPLILEELLAAQGEYHTWPGRTDATFSHIENILRQRGHNVPESR